MNPLVTVVIPSFNRGGFVVDAIESVLTQSYRPIEIVVIDDGSEDDTAERLAPYIAQQQIQYHYQKNQGAAVARNNAIAQSSADYIALLDSDDLWLPQKLESQIDYLQTHPEVAMVAAHVLPIGKERNLLDDRPIFATQQEGFVSFLNVLHHSPLHVSTLVIRRQALPSPPFPAGVHFCEDWQMCLQVAQHNPVWFIGEVMTHVRIHENNITLPLAPQSQLEAKLHARLGVLHRVSELMGTDTIELSRAVAKEHADYAIASYANGECATAQHHLSLAWKHDRLKWQGEELATQIGHFASLIFHQSGEEAMYTFLREIEEGLPQGFAPHQKRKLRRTLYSRTTIFKVGLTALQQNQPGKALQMIGSGLLQEPRYLLNRGVVASLIRAIIALLRHRL